MSASKNGNQSRTPLLVGNWKMNKDFRNARSSYLEIAARVAHLSNRIQIGVAPTTLHLMSLAERRQGSAGLYAQNAHWKAAGAYTGEVSATMLAELGVRGALVAHSERRQMNAETNHTAGLKIRALLESGLDVIYCVGESLEEREGDKLAYVLSTQITEALSSAKLQDLGAVTAQQRSRFTIAYEPVWAIGTGKAASEKEAQEAHAIIRQTLLESTHPSFANETRILYGGSVKPANILSFMSQPDVDGALVGGASLEPDSFEALCEGVLKSIS